MIIDIEGIRFKYNGVDILKNMSLKIAKGKVTGIIGPNGSGKTTLLKCMNRILSPYKGAISLEEKNLKRYSLNEIAKTVGYVPQSEGRAFPTTVFETIMMGRKPHIRWAQSKRDLDRVSEVIELLGLDDISHRNINKLSGGQRQKVVIGRALAQEPKILLLDEPTANLDIRHELEVMDIIRDQSKYGVTVLMSVHDLNLAARYCDNILMLKRGRIYAAGGREVLNPKNIRAVYGINVKVIRDSKRDVIIPLSSN